MATAGNRMQPCKGSALPTELIARTCGAMGNPLGGAPYAAPETGTQGTMAAQLGTAIPALFPNGVRAPFPLAARARLTKGAL